MRFRMACLSASLLLGVAACGSDNGLTLGTVSGRVTYKGEPIKSGTVMFEPDESKGTTGPQAIGTIKEDGTYILSSSDAADGAVVGTHKVGVLGLDPTPVPAAAGKEEMPTPEQDPMKFLQMKTQAGLKAARQSARGGAGKTVTGLDGKTYRMIVPEKVSSTNTSGLTATVSRGSNTINIDVAEDGTAKVSQ